MKTALVLILSLLATACSVEEIQDQFTSQSDPRESIEGKTWTTDCLATNTGGFQKRTVLYSYGTYTLTTTVYSDLCETVDVEIKETGSYNLLGTTSDNSIMIKLNRIVNDYSVTPFNASIATAFRSASLCGLATWEAGISMSVLGKVCNGANLPTAGQVTYDLYAIALDSSLLRFGIMDSVTNGTSPGSRPTALATNPTFHKIP